MSAGAALTAAKAISPIRRKMDTMRERTGILSGGFRTARFVQYLSVVNDQGVCAGQEDGEETRRRGRREDEVV